MKANCMLTVKIAITLSVLGILITSGAYAKKIKTIDYALTTDATTTDVSATDASTTDALETDALANTDSINTVLKKTVLFNENITPEEINAFVSEWETSGVSLIRSLPFINGALLSVPDTITSADLLNDYRVAHVEDSEQEVKLQSLDAAADGGSADGGSTYTDLTYLNVNVYFTMTDRPPKGHRPWGVNKVNEAPYDPLACTSAFDESLYELPLVTEAISLLENRATKIAIFDSGVATRHPYLDGVVKGGVDFVDMNEYYQMDYNGHGTHVTGVLGGKLLNNKFGLIPGAYLYMVKVLDENAIGNVASLVMGLQWAIDNDIDVINMSVAYAKDSPALRLAVQKVHEAGIVMVAAAGNHSNWDVAAPTATADGGSADGGSLLADGSLTDETATTDTYPVMYPAKYPEVIAVGATDPFGQEASFSNTGPEVDLLAPGVNVLSTVLLNGFGVGSGTSMAVPHVTAAAAMMLALNPQLIPDQIRTILMETAINGELSLVGALQAATAQ